MSKRTTVVFHDEDLYTCLNVGAAKWHRLASDIIAESVRKLL